MRPLTSPSARAFRRGTACLAALVAAVGLTAAAPASASSYAVRRGPSGRCRGLGARAHGIRQRRLGLVLGHVRRPVGDPRARRLVVRLRDVRPAQAGDSPGAMHMARTRDWSSWEYLGTVFDAGNRPSWATPTSGLWAPDIRYVAGRYVLYFTVTDTTLHPGDDSAIGAATAPTPSGPVDPAPAPAVPPRPASGGGFLWTFDPAGFTDADGQRYLYYGSYFGGLWVTRMSADGLTPVGTATQVAVDNRYEGSYVVRHGDFYYLMGSAANCCAGPTTGYSVFAGRVALAARAVPRRRGHAAAHLARRRHDRADAERQPLRRRRPPCRRHRRRGARLHRLPRHRPDEPVADDDLRHQPPAHAARPSRLGRRLAAHPRRGRAVRHPAAGPDPGLGARDHPDRPVGGRLRGAE